MSELKVNKISPATGTAFTLGDSGDTFTVPSGATITNSGTATGFGGGKCLQSVSAYSSTEVSTTAAIPLDNTVPLISEGLEVVSKAFTPVSATSNIHIYATLSWGPSTSARAITSLFDSRSTDSIATVWMNETNTEMIHSTILCVVASGSTTARTYSMRTGPAGASYTVRVNSSGGGTSYFGSTIPTSGIIITEFEV